MTIRENKDRKVYYPLVMALKRSWPAEKIMRRRLDNAGRRLLTSIPNLDFDFGSIGDSDFSVSKLDTDGGFIFQSELVRCETRDDVGFTDTGVARHED